MGTPIRLVDRSSSVELGSRVYQGESCAPGWSRIELINVFVNSSTAATARLEVESSALQDGTPERTIGSSADVRIVPP